MMRFLLLLLLLIVCSGCASTVSKIQRETIPPSVTYAFFTGTDTNQFITIVRTKNAEGDTFQTVMTTENIPVTDCNVLAWQIKEDNRPLYVESMILVQQAKGGACKLYHLYRHPREPVPNDSKDWVVWKSTFASAGECEFPKPPSQEDVIQFFRDTRWDFTLDYPADWHIHSVGIDAQAWKRLTQQDPPIEFAAAVAEARKNNRNAIIPPQLVPVHHPLDFSSMKLATKPISLLGNRLQVRMPKGARVEGNTGDIMSTQESNENETRVVFEQKGNKLVLMAHETFSTAGRDFATQVTKMDQSMSKDGRVAKSRLLVKQDNFLVYQTDITPVDTNREAIAISSAWVVNTDNTVQVLFAYANPSAATEPPDVAKLYAQVFKTLTPGKKQLLISAGTRQLETYSETKRLAIDLPAGFIATVQRGPDFMVHRIQRIVPFGEEGQSIGMYLGDGPTHHHRRNGASDIKESEGKLIGEKVSWFQYSGNGNVCREAIRPCPELDDSLQLHLFCSASTEDGLTELDRIVQTLKFVQVGDTKKDVREQTPAADVLKGAHQE